jgi:hypothetical protein
MIETVSAVASIKPSWNLPDWTANMNPPEAFVGELWVNGGGLASRGEYRVSARREKTWFAGRKRSV